MRTRFAPSPTGLLHIGGLRTALYAYLLAKQSGGSFILRIEDTDRAREVAGAVENILESLQWAGIHPDEGVMLKNGKVTQEGSHGPYIQSERFELYKKHADELLEKGFAYRCFCTPGRLEEMRKEQESKRQAPMYDRRCVRLTAEEVQKNLADGVPHVIRMKVPHDQLITFNDEIRGEVKFQSHTIDDQVLMKSDGFPTYHLANVVDDHYMDIDIVTRGEEWLSSTPKHLLLFEFFGWKAPRYAHFPLLLNQDKSKLSKRQGDVDTLSYRTKGYLPEAIVNFLALLGWNPGTTQDIFSLRELVEQFSLEHVQKAGAVFDTQKLDWLQGQWMRRLSIEEFADRIKPIVSEKFSAVAGDTDFRKKAALIQERITFFHEAPDMMGFYYADPTPTMELIANPKQKITADMVPMLLTTLIETFEPVSEKDWHEEHLLSLIKKVMEEKGLKLGQLLWPMRAALTGLPFSPGAFEVAVALGKNETMKRLKAALSSL